MKLNQRIWALASAAMLTCSMLPGTFEPARAADGQKVKIMPLGDSITYGMADEGGYRKYLDVALKQKGCTNFDFVGPEGSGSATFNYRGQTMTYDCRKITIPLPIPLRRTGFGDGRHMDIRKI